LDEHIFVKEKHLGTDAGFIRRRILRSSQFP
jgi:hypothetical protein